jgi:RNA polymerase sigma-70 factor (ECF subfamily)
MTVRPDPEQWYRQYAYAVHARCVTLLGSKAEAEDALHEVFVRVQRKLPKEAPEHPLRWLYRIADNHCFDLLKHRKWRQRWALGEQAAHPPAGPVDPRAPEAQRFVSQVLVSCKPEVREVAVLYFLDELTQDEIAQQVGCSRKTVKERLARFQEVAASLSHEGVSEVNR